MIMTSEFILLEDICLILHIGKSTAYKLIQSGILPAVKIGGKWQVQAKDLDEYISTMKEKPKL